MKTIIATALIALISACAGAQTDVLFTLSDFNAYPTTNRTVSLRKMQPFLGDEREYSSSSVGYFYASNQAAGDYAVTIKQKGSARAINFQITVTATNLGVVSAYEITSVSGVATYPTAGKSAWSIAASDARYTNSGASSGTTYTNNSTGLPGVIVGSGIGTNIHAFGALTNNESRNVNLEGNLYFGGVSTPSVEINASSGEAVFDGEVTALSFSGGGGGLTAIPDAAVASTITRDTELTAANTVVSNGVVTGLAAGSLPINGALATNVPFSYIDYATTPSSRFPGKPNHANLDRLWSFQNTLEYSNRPVRILVVTDELGFPGDETFVTNLERLFPMEGGLANGVGYNGGISYTRSNAFAYGSTTAADVITNYINTDTRYFYTNGAANNYKRNDPNLVATNFFIDTLSVCYQRAPYAGTFKIQTNFNGTWGDMLTVDTVSADTNVAFTNVTFPVLTNRTFRLLSMTGTNEFLGVGCWNSTTNDLLWGKFYINAGPTLETVANARTNCSWPWWKFLNPDLIMILDSGLLKVDGADFRARISNTVAKLELMWSNTCPLADVIHFGWVQTYNDNITEYNAELYDQCIRTKRGFFDVAYYARLSDMVDPTYGMTNRQIFESDLVHPLNNGMGAAYLNNALWKELFPPGTIFNSLYANPKLRGTGAKFMQGKLGNIQNTTNLGTFYGVSGSASTPSFVVDNDFIGRDVWCRQLISTGATAEVTYRMQTDNNRTIRLSGKGTRVFGVTEATTDVYFAVTNNGGAISYGWSMNGYPAGYAVQMGTLANRYRLYTSTTFMGMTNVTANRTLDADDHTVVFNGTSLTATLPTAVGALGKTFVVKNLNATALTVARTSSQTIDGVAADDSITVGLAITYTSDGTGWIRTARY